MTLGLGSAVIPQFFLYPRQLGNDFAAALSDDRSRRAMNAIEVDQPRSLEGLDRSLLRIDDRARTIGVLHQDRRHRAAQPDAINFHVLWGRTPG